MKLLFGILAITVLMPIQAQIIKDTDTLMANRIKSEAIDNSRAIETLNYLTNVLGARLTNSKNQLSASHWTKDQFIKMGLKAEVEPWGEFGKGWDVKSFRANMTAPYALNMIAYPKAWSPSTNGVVKGKIIYVNEKSIDSAKAKFEGKLKNAIVFLGDKIKIEESFDAVAKRWSDSELLEMANSPAADGAMMNFREQFRKSPAYKAYFEKLKIFTWINSQKPALLVDAGAFSIRGGAKSYGIVNVQGANMPLADEKDVFGPLNPKAYAMNAPAIVPQVVMSTEQFNQIVELTKNGKEVSVECDLQVEWQTKDSKAYNTIAEWEGTDLKEEIVMIGGHLDSWHSSTGATDNAAGATAMIEAIRILKAMGVQPRRTIRVGLWSGEEQGLLGSKGYVKTHDLGKNDKFSVYYNLDNGGGQIRGIYMQGNEKVQPLFRKWFEPFRSWNASTLTMQNTGSTDHISFDEVGLPGFEFIQDPIAYSGKTWHTNMDMSDHVIPQDLMRSSAIVAYFVYMSAMRDEKIGRKVLESKAP